MEEDNLEYSFDSEAFEAVRKFEDMKSKNMSCFFDVIEFESIIDYYIESDNFTRAYEAASLASQQHPNSIPIQLRKARVLIDRGRAVEAMSILKKIEQIEPGNYEIYIAKGTALGILGDITGAEKMFDYALSLESDDTEGNGDILFSIVSVLQNLNYYEQSIPYLKSLIDSEPTCYSHLYDMAYAYERIEDYDNSIKYYLRFLEEEPYSDNAWYNLGIIYNKKGEYLKAIEAYDFSLAINDQNSFAIFNKANICWYLERYKDAIQLYLEYLEHEPDNYEAMTYLAESYARIGEDEKAQKYYNDAIDINSDFPESWYGLGVIAYNNNEADQCIKYLLVATSKDPENSEYWFLLGKAFVLKHETKKAIRCYKKGLEMDIYFYAIWADLGKLLIDENVVSKALSYIKKSIKIAGDVPGPNCLLAVLYNHLGDDEMTMTYLSRAIKLDKDAYESFSQFFTQENTSITVMSLLKENNLI